MNLLITTDLHLDMWGRAGCDPFIGIVPVLRDLDALIVAGDLAGIAESAGVNFAQKRVLPLP